MSSLSSLVDFKMPTLPRLHTCLPMLTCSAETLLDVESLTTLAHKVHLHQAFWYIQFCILYVVLPCRVIHEV